MSFLELMSAKGVVDAEMARYLRQLPTAKQQNQAMDIYRQLRPVLMAVIVHRLTDGRPLKKVTWFDVTFPKEEIRQMQWMILLSGIGVLSLLHFLWIWGQSFHHWFMRL